MTQDDVKALAVLIKEVSSQPRPTTIHASPCKDCPSAWYARNGEVDEESEQIKASCPRAEQIDSAFRCAWRREKLCKDYCDFLNVTEVDLQR